MQGLTSIFKAIFHINQTSCVHYTFTKLVGLLHNQTASVCKLVFDCLFCIGANEWNMTYNGKPSIYLQKYVEDDSSLVNTGLLPIGRFYDVMLLQIHTKTDSQVKVSFKVTTAAFDNDNVWNH